MITSQPCGNYSVLLPNGRGGFIEGRNVNPDYDFGTQDEALQFSLDYPGSIVVEFHSKEWADWLDESAFLERLGTL